jgi:PAS domain S-box-containing protein
LEAQLAVASEIAGAIEEQRLHTALSESELKFRRLFEETKDAITVSTSNGQLTNVNQAAVDLFGFSSKEEMLRLRDETDLYVHPADRKVLIEEASKHGFLKDVELRLRRKTGERILVEATITALENPGETPSYQAVLRDITMQKENERKLHESEEKYRILVEDSLVGVYVIQDNKFAFVNRRFAEIFGYSQTQIMETTQVQDLVSPEDRERVTENIRKRAAGEMKSLRYGFRGLKKNGEVIEVEVYGNLSSFMGRSAVIGTVLDRTQEHQHQREIAEWRQRYDLIIASSGGVVYEYNVVNGTILWSGSIERVLGYKMSELRGDIQEWEDLIHLKDRAEAVEQLDRAQKRHEPYDVEYRFRRKDGSYVWMHDRGFFLADSGGRVTKMLGMMEDVTEQKELEKRVGSSELRHRLLFEHANDAVFVMEGEWFIDCNPRAMEMFGCRLEDIVGQTPYAFSPPHQAIGSESREASLRYIGAALGGKPQRFAWRHIKRDGTPFEAEVRLNRFEMEGKAYLQAQVRDITAELNAREELARSEEKYRRLILEAGEAIMVTDGEGKITEANDKACALLQYEREHLLQLSVTDIGEGQKEELIAGYRAFYAQLISDENVFVVERRLRRKDGSTFDCEMSAVLLGSGMLQSIMRDVTEKKRAEKELDQIYTIATSLFGADLFEKGAVALAELLNLGHVVVGELDEEARRIRALTYYREGEIVRDMSYDLAGTPCEQVVLRREECEVGESVQSRFPLDQFLKDWGLESYFGIPMFDSNRKVLGLVCIMDRKSHAFSEHEKKIASIVAQRMASEIEMLLQRKREEHLSHQLLQSQKMESLGTLAGGIAHDFNNILGAVIGYTSLIKRQIDPGSQPGRYLEAIEKSAQRAASLTRQLLSFSHKTHGEIKSVSVNDLINDTIHILGSSFPKSIKIETDLSPKDPKILGDQNLLGQVIMNLCINARDAIMEGGKNAKTGLLKIMTSQFQAGAGFVDLHLSAAPGDYVCITVSDNGIGMTPELKRRIFEPFFTTKGKGKGTGLGLSMVYGIVRNHNGLIDVYSEPEIGTTFKIFIPTAEEGEQAEVSLIEAELPLGNGETIMIAEDEPMLRELVADVLTEQGYKVVLACNGLEAVEAYKREKEKIQLVILDMIMPEMDGTAAFSALRELNPELKIIISSGFSQDSAVQKLLSSGASGFVGKPYQTEDLLKAIARELNSNNA